MLPVRVCLLLSTLGLLLFGGGESSSQEVRPRVLVKFHEPEVIKPVQATGPIDPTVRIQISNAGQMSFGLQVGQSWLCCGTGAIRTAFRIDGQLVQPVGQPVAPMIQAGVAKPVSAFRTTHSHAGVAITQDLEVVPSKATKSGEKRQLDTVLIKYTFENKGNSPRKIETRVRIDSMCGSNDGALFAAPSVFPKKVLNGMELRGKSLPDFVQILENPDLNNPGFTGHFTLKMQNAMVGPDRFICTTHGAGDDGWEVQIVPANGDTDCALYWSPKVVPAGGKIVMAYGYGRGLLTLGQGDGKFNVSLSGSFEPSKVFNVMALVDDPASHQTLTLDLPEGLKLIEGKHLQPVAPPGEGTPTSAVLWRCQVERLGEYVIRVRSNDGGVQTRKVTISAAS